jgi:UDP-N-acetyl-2-amino-2-deoxyglucuronate dehydrogenase
MVSGVHGRALTELRDGIEVLGVFSRDPQKRAAFGEKFGFPVAGSLDAMLSDPAIDAVLVLTPPNARTEIVTAAARAGKHVLLEKPVERNSKNALEIVETCERAGVTLGIVFQHRFRAASIALKKLVETGRFGEVTSVQVVVPWWRPQSYYDEPGRGTYARDGGGVLISQAIHTLDLLHWLIGSPEEVQAVAATTRLHRMEAEDFVGAGLRFANGAPGALMATTAAFPGSSEHIVIGFEKASVRLQGGELTIHHHTGEIETIGEPAATGGGGDPMAFSHEWHQALIADFAQSIREGRAPVVTGRQALAVHRLIDALILSSAEKLAVRVQGAEPA